MGKPQTIQQLTSLKVDHSEIYKEIELTPEEMEIAILKAKMEKSARLKTKAYAEKVMKEPEYNYTPITWEQAFDNFKNTPGIVIDQYNEEIAINLCKYFTGDESGAYSLKKGLLLFGNVGCGKSTFMDYFKFNQFSSFIIKSCIIVTDEYAANGHEYVMRYNHLINYPEPHLSFGQKKIGVCFDDMGAEDLTKHYGNQRNVIANILLNRYDHNKDLIAKTHVVTNLTSKEISDFYGTRLASRMVEMFNIIAFHEKAPDRRK